MARFVQDEFLQEQVNHNLVLPLVELASHHLAVEGWKTITQPKTVHCIFLHGHNLNQKHVHYKQSNGNSI